VFGAVIATEGVVMEKATLLRSLAGPSTHVTRIEAVVEGGPETNHGKVPVPAAVFWTEAARTSHEAPPLRDNSIRTKALAPRL
jgi:hypothetical protein